ncbi:MAG: carboxypeptidase-like regulatory domain-containing protein [Blastocatellia bacterium]
MRKMLNDRLSQISVTLLLTIVACLSLASATYAQQPGIKELPIVEKPRERSSTDRVTIKTLPSQPSKGVLAVVLDPVVSGQVIVKDSTGRVVSKLEADKDGQAEFPLARNKVYQIEANYPGFLAALGKSRPLKASEIVRLRLTPQFAKLVLTGLPVGAQVQLNGQQSATADQTGITAVNDLKPGDYSLLIQHPEYNDYVDTLKGLVAGATFNLRILPVRVAKLEIKGPVGATVMIDGAVQGKIQSKGNVRIDYALENAARHTISVELLGYQPWSQAKELKPGPDMIEVRLDPVVTSGGISDQFDSFFNWRNAPSWELVKTGTGSNKRLRVKGPELGLLKDQVYRDIHEDSVFLLWLDDGKGASWVVKSDKEGHNYYLFHLAGPKSTTHEPNKFYTYVVRDGASPEVVSLPFPVLVKLDETSSYEIHIEVSGERVRHWITPSDTGEKMGLGSWTDTGPTKEKFLYGTFGFRSLSGEVFSVDELALATKKQN